MIISRRGWITLPETRVMEEIFGKKRVESGNKKKAE